MSQTACSMKWEPVSTNDSTTEYELTDAGEVKAKLRYNASQHSIRIYCNDVKRLFFIEHTGFLKSKTIFTNEYGVEVGKLHNNTSVEYNGNKYNYYFSSTNQLVAFNKKASHSLAECELKLRKGHDSDEVSALLLGLHCYLFKPRVEMVQSPALV
jgi:hypothetical protein